jgi:hypothetical protein
LGQSKRIVGGRFVDDEIIFFDDNGFYAGTPEAAYYVYLRFPGLPGYYSLHQFRVSLNKPELIQALLKGDNPSVVTPSLAIPPIVDLQVTVLSRSHNSVKMRLSIKAESSGDLASVRVYLDGRLDRELMASGSRGNFVVDLDVSPWLRWITVEAIDSRRYESIPVAAKLPAAAKGDAGVGRLFGLAIGTDHYTEKDRLSELGFARSDAQNITSLIASAVGGYYTEVHAETPLLDEVGLNKSLPEKRKAIDADARAEDTIILFLSDHGITDHGTLYLATIDTRLDDLNHTAVAWDRIAAALVGAKARVVVILDTCHSGVAAGQEGTNDGAAYRMYKENEHLFIEAQFL